MFHLFCYFLLVYVSRALNGTINDSICFLNERTKRLQQQKTWCFTSSVVSIRTANYCHVFFYFCFVSYFILFSFFFIAWKRIQCFANSHYAICGSILSIHFFVFWLQFVSLNGFLSICTNRRWTRFCFCIDVIFCWRCASVQTIWIRWFFKCNKRLRTSGKWCNSNKMNTKYKSEKDWKASSTAISVFSWAAMTIELRECNLKIVYFLNTFTDNRCCLMFCGLFQ